MERFKKKEVGISLLILTIISNVMSTFASGDVDAPTLTEVRSIVDSGLDLFFGALGAFAVIMGGVEFYKAFISFKDSREKGGYGASKSDLTFHVIAGVLCLIGAVVIFVVLGWTKDLFSI